MDSLARLHAIAEHFLNAIPHCRECGLHAERIAAGDVQVGLPYRDAWIGDIERGVLHTGIVTLLVDSTCSLAVLTALAQPEGIATLDLRMDYLRPSVKNEDLHCRAECYRLTTHIAFVRAEVWQTDPDQPVAVSQASFMRVGSTVRAVS